MKRNRFDVSVDILKVTENGARKTSMVYGANLNFNIIKKYIASLIKSKLLEYNNPYYFTTFKGQRFMRRYEDLRGELLQ